MPTVELPSKPGAPMAYELVGSGSPLVVFVNGLGLPSMSWKATVGQMQESGKHAAQFLTFDRWGQGATTAKDPGDSRPGREEGYGHDFEDAVADLSELVRAVAPDRANRLVIVSASIGVHIARLYAAKHPGTVEGLLLLDSNIGNVEFTDLWPDPNAPDFKESDVVGDDCSLPEYKEAYAKLGKMFNSDVRSPEGLDRRNLKNLLPDPSQPKLVGPDGKGPWLVVAGHDPDHFAEEGLKMMKTPKSLTAKYSQPAWHKYNEGLCKLSDPDRTTGVVFAPGCGHFIQKDDPKFVATQLEHLLDKVGKA